VKLFFREPFAKNGYPNRIGFVQLGSFQTNLVHSRNLEL